MCIFLKVVMTWIYYFNTLNPFYIASKQDVFCCTTACFLKTTKHFLNSSKMHQLMIYISHLIHPLKTLIYCSELTISHKTPE